MTPPPPLRQKVPTLPPDVEQVVLTALAKEPHQRFASVQAFANALEQASQQRKQSVSKSFQSNTVPPQPESPPRSRVLAQPITPTIEIDTPVAQPLPPTIAARAEQPHTQAKPQPSAVTPPVPKQSSSLSSAPRHKVKSTAKNTDITGIELVKVRGLAIVVLVCLLSTIRQEDYTD